MNTFRLAHPVGKWFQPLALVILCRGFAEASWMASPWLSSWRSWLGPARDACPDMPRHAPTHFSVPRCVKKYQVPRHAAGAQVSDVHTVDCSSLSVSQCPTDDNLGQGPVNMQVGV